MLKRADCKNETLNRVSEKGAPNSSDGLVCNAWVKRQRQTNEKRIASIESPARFARMRLTKDYLTIVFGQCRIRGLTRYAARLL